MEEQDFLNQLSDFVSDSDNALVFKKEVGNYESKEFLIMLQGGYAVRHNGKIIYHTTQPYPVLQEYNKIILSNQNK